MQDITFVLSCEHQGILLKLQRLEEALAGGMGADFREALGALEHVLGIHQRREEEVLFPELLRLPHGRTAVVAGLIEEHRDVQDHLEELHRALEGRATASVYANTHHVLRQMRDHIWREDHLVFPAAEEVLPEAARDRVMEGLHHITCACATCEHVFEAAAH